MINPSEVPMYLGDALPDLSPRLALHNNYNAAEAMSALTSFMCSNLNNHDFKTVKRCFQIADKLYAKGNNSVKDAVQNVFVYSFTKMFQHYPDEKKQILALVPGSLYTLYMKQVYHGGC